MSYRAIFFCVMLLLPLTFSGENTVSSALPRTIGAAFAQIPPSSSAFHSSGSPEIDGIRKSVSKNPTDGGSMAERGLLLYLWLGALQQQGADVSTFFDIDGQFHRLEADVNRTRAGGGDPYQTLGRLCRTIDRGYQVMEGIQNTLAENGSLTAPRQGLEPDIPRGGDMDAEWPMFQGNMHNTGYTEAPGPRYGRAAWKFPVGLGWYSRPVVEGSRVYLASPGMDTIGYCLDLQTGEEIWTARQLHPEMGIYKYPAISSTPVVLEDWVLFREMNSHGGNRGQAKNIVFVDKKTGKVVSREYAGHVDYRTQYANVSANKDFIVYPFGIHDIYDSPPVCQNFNRLICRDGKDKRILWDLNIGDISALAEPVLTAERVIAGTMEGYLYALSLKEHSEGERIAWTFKAEGSVNTRVEVVDGRVYFGSNGGSVYCLDEATGKEIWQARVAPVERRTRKHFSTPCVDKGRVYIGAANQRLYCFNQTDGELIWEQALGDWIRSRPAVTPHGVYAACVDGKLYCVSEQGRLKWARNISPHPIYADISCSGDRLLLSDSNLYLYCLDPAGEVIWRRSILRAFSKEGERIFSDQLSGGTYYQSKPTAYRGRIYFGTPAGFLYALDAKEGKEVWKYEMGGAISVGPACADGKVYAGQQGGERYFYSVDAMDGSLRWKQTIPGGWVWGSAAVDDGRVYVPTVSGYAVCLDGETGNILWMYPTAKSVPAEPAIHGDLVYFGSWSRSLYAFQKHRGDVVWKYTGNALDSGTLIADRGRIYLPHHRDVFRSLDAKTGEMLCGGSQNEEKKGNYSNFNASGAYHNGRVFFSARVGVGLRGVPVSCKVFSLDAETGEIIWTYPDGGGLSAPAIANGRVYIGSSTSPFFYCLDEKTGDCRWIYKMGHRVEESTPCIYRDRIYVLSADGYLHAVE